MKGLIALLAGAMLAGCSGGEHEDLRQWMQEASRDIRGRVPPLPEMKPYRPVAYSGDRFADPFNPARADASADFRPGAGSLRPDPGRPREPLESFALETLRFVGSLTRDGVSYALIQADGRLARVRVGNHLGQDFGVIRKITPREVTLRELVQDAGGVWSERISVLHLQATETEK